MMKQVMVTEGKGKLRDVPVPQLGPGQVLVEVTHSFISVGTEMTALKSSGKTLLERIIQNPSSVKQGLKSLVQNGIARTWMMVESVQQAENQVGYSCAGRVIAVGNTVHDIFVGDRVSCAGAGYAHHAEIVTVPRNLVVNVPDGLGLKEAAVGTVGAIAMQGVRRADVRLGERVGVVGLGLLGQISVQLLLASGCRVLGIDLVEDRRQRTIDLGAQRVLDPTTSDVVKEASAFGNGQGLDVTIITAAANDPSILQQAMQMTRRKGRVVLVGAVPITFDRNPFYAKELDFLISCSYGPGRYDPRYEEEGIDYPYAYVRWTENRNIQEFLELAAEGRLSIPSFYDKVFPSENVEDAYAALRAEGTKPLGVMLEFPAAHRKEASTVELTASKRVNLKATGTGKNGAIRVAIVGAGSFARGMHMKNMKQMDDLFTMSAIVGRQGGQARKVAVEYQIPTVSTNIEELAQSGDVDGFLICTRHHLHAEQSIAALRAGKSVFCEKPAGLSHEEIDAVMDAAVESSGIYTIGFNRRFSPAALKIAELVSKRQSPLMMVCRIAAGHLPLDHWTQGPEGGGRIIGEGCHWIDLMQSWVGDDVVVESFQVETARPKQRGHWTNSDNAVITVRYADGSVGTLIYTAMACKKLEKELMEVHWDGNSAIIHDFKKLEYLTPNGGGQSIWQSEAADKGHIELLKRWGRGCRTGVAPIGLVSLMATSKLSCEIALRIQGNGSAGSEKTGVRQNGTTDEHGA